MLHLPALTYAVMLMDKTVFVSSFALASAGLSAASAMCNDRRCQM